MHRVAGIRVLRLGVGHCMGPRSGVAIMAPRRPPHRRPRSPPARRGCLPSAPTGGRGSATRTSPPSPRLSRTAAPSARVAVRSRVWLPWRRSQAQTAGSRQRRLGTQAARASLCVCSPQDPGRACSIGKSIAHGVAPRSSRGWSGGGCVGVDGGRPEAPQSRSPDRHGLVVASHMLDRRFHLESLRFRCEIAFAVISLDVARGVTTLFICGAAQRSTGSAAARNRAA